MTAIVGIKFSDGIVIEADSLAVAPAPFTRPVSDSKIEQIFKNSKKLYRISKYVVLGVSCQDLIDTVLEGTIREIRTRVKTHDADHLSVESVSGIVLEEFKNAKKYDEHMGVELLIAGLDVRDGKPSSARFWFVNSDLELSEDKTNYSSVGARPMINGELSRRGITLSALTPETAKDYANQLMLLCSDYERAAIEAQHRSAHFHVGGRVTRMVVDKNGVRSEPSGLKLDIRVRKGDPLYGVPASAD